MVLFLVTSNANLEAKETISGYTPLHLAVASGRNDIAVLLLSHRADVNCKDKFGETPLERAVGQPQADLDTVKLLLTLGADVNSSDRYGETPLDLAAIYGTKEEVELLLAHKADVNVKNSAGKTPLDQAKAQGHKDIEALLLPLMANTNKVR
jgi:26S proteasome non-ATPase regulatory subunit 10